MERYPLGGSKWLKAFTFLCVVFGFLMSAMRVGADQIQVNYALGGRFIVVRPDNPWGGTDPYSLHFQARLSFLMPTTADLLSTDPYKAAWNTTASASVTANGITVDFAGPATIGINANIIPPMAGGRSSAWVSLPGFSVGLYCDPGPLFAGYSNDSIDNLLSLHGYANVTTQSSFNEKDEIWFLGVSSVPDVGSTLALFGSSLIGLVLFRRWLVK